MKVTVCQYDIRWEDKTSNLRTAERMVRAAEGGLVVLPEMFTTGFTPRAAAVAEPMSGATVSALRRWAAEYGKAVTGSAVIVDDGGRLRNRQLFVKPSGETVWYDKRHLFRPGGEARDLVPGESRVVVEYGGVRFLLLVCYDLRFPVWSRNRGDCDAIICSASWPAARGEVWSLLLRARAVENQVYVVGANRVGDDPSAHYGGQSAIVDFRGRTLAGAEKGEKGEPGEKRVPGEPGEQREPEPGGEAEAALTAEIDLGALERFRERFPAWRDADDFEMNL